MGQNFGHVDRPQSGRGHHGVGIGLGKEKKKNSGQENEGGEEMQPWEQKLFFLVKKLKI